MKYLNIFLLALLANSAFSQVVNIENKRANDGTYGFSGALDMTLSMVQQKDLLVTVHLKPLIQYKFSGKSDAKYKRDMDSNKVISLHEDSIVPDKNKHLLLLINDLKYTGARKNTYANFGMSHLRYAYRIGNSGWKWESYGQLQYNQLLLQKVRGIVGTGLRAKLLDVHPDSENKAYAMRLFAGSSVYYEYEEIKYSDRPMEYLNQVRWSTYLSTYFNFKHFEFISSTYIQPNLARFKDYRISGDYALLLRVSEPFSVKLNYTHFYDAFPPINVTRRTFSFSVGFVYKLDKFQINPEKMKENRERRAQRKAERLEEDF